MCRRCLAARWTRSWEERPWGRQPEEVTSGGRCVVEYSKEWGAQDRFGAPAKVVSVTFMKGGDAYNVIPESVSFGGTFRSLTTESLSYLKKRIKEIIEAHVAVNRCTVTVDFMEEERRPYPATVNDEGMYDHARAVAEAMLGEGNVKVGAPLMAAEDFAFYAQKFAGAFFMIGVGNKTTMETVHPLHSPYFVIDEDVLPVGSAFHAAVAMEYLNKRASATN